MDKKLTLKEERALRDRKIVQMVDVEIRTMTAIAKFFGISKQRVKQIYDREKAKDV